MPDLLTHLATRRSAKLGDLGPPGPTPAERDAILTLACRSPDHGKLVPWRFIVFEGAGQAAAGRACAAIFRADRPEATADQIAAEAGRFARAPLVVAVVSRTAPHPKIPQVEQLLSAAAVAMNLVHAACAHGFAATWVTEWVAFDRRCLDALGLGADETLVGFVYIGTRRVPADERPRPALADVVTMYPG